MPKHIDVIGVPIDVGGGRSGACHGPRALIASGIVQKLEAAGHTVSCKDIFEGNVEPVCLASAPSPPSKTRTLYVDEVGASITLLAARTFASLRVGHTPLILGGDHSVVIGSVGAALHPDLLCGKKLGLVWIDAHYDAHTGKTTSSGNANGMPLASLLGMGLREFRTPISNRKIQPKNVLHIGAGKADCEPQEIALLERLNVRCFTEEHILTSGILPICDAYDELCTRVDLIWVSFDIDAVNQYWAPGVAYPNKGGFSYSMLMHLVDRLASRGKIIGADIVEYAPHKEEYDPLGFPKTATLATEFALRLFQ
jgi:arginase